MKKQTFSALVLVFLMSATSYAQVGINTETPRATLEVVAQQPDGTTNEGFLAPQIGKQRLANIQQDKLVGGTLVYVLDVDSYDDATPADSIAKNRVAEVLEPGFYWYNKEKDKWLKTMGKDGQGIRIRGRVEEFSDLPNYDEYDIEVGDIFYVSENGTLYYYDGETYASLGRIKGEDGITYNIKESVHEFVDLKDKEDNAKLGEIYVTEDDGDFYTYIPGEPAFDEDNGFLKDDKGNYIYLPGKEPKWQKVGSALPILSVLKPKNGLIYNKTTAEIGIVDGKKHGDLLTWVEKQGEDGKVGGSWEPKENRYKDGILRGPHIAYECTESKIGRTLVTNIGRFVCHGDRFIYGDYLPVSQYFKYDNFLDAMEDELISYIDDVILSILLEEDLLEEDDDDFLETILAGAGVYTIIEDVINLRERRDESPLFEHNIYMYSSRGHVPNLKTGTMDWNYKVNRIEIDDMGRLTFSNSNTYAVNPTASVVLGTDAIIASAFNKFYYDLQKFLEAKLSKNGFKPRSFYSLLDKHINVFMPKYIVADDWEEEAPTITPNKLTENSFPAEMEAISNTKTEVSTNNFSQEKTLLKERLKQKLKFMLKQKIETLKKLKEANK